MKTVVIAGYARTPFTVAKKGALAGTRPDEMAAQLVKKFVARSGINAADIEDLLLGCAIPEGEQGLNMARLVVLMAGLPQTVGGQTINRFCGSSMQGIHTAAGAIQMGAGEAFICAGVESMTRVPMTGFNLFPHPDLARSLPGAYMGMGDTAENVARQWDISRADQEAFAFQSHQRAAKAQAAGYFKDEIIPVDTKKGIVDTDGCIRTDTSPEALAQLKPAFTAEGTVTAGTSSPLTDGAAATIVCSAEYADKNGLKPFARVASIAIAGVAPEIMGIGPIEASRKALARAGIKATALDVVELNEAFAAQALACIRDLDLDPAKVNIDGGAIAVGHPLGASGARITGKAASLLKRTGGRYALATMCIGGGQGIATVLEAV
ncbi:thiolase family protein [Rhizomicrobium electricum]|uniref:acetyl-CoA C-acyltransferase n=1 Tax=Rhizomicrobium electricum TaxID=480070 RepID=A0ABN1ELK4_9PROT|nr:thiolase family protein [Rhizomicrobium electricum]NIJ47023.1 acetyl-CoA acyltransferase [Rhizomicrobium electricum]